LAGFVSDIVRRRMVSIHFKRPTGHYFTCCFAVWAGFGFCSEVASFSKQIKKLFGVKLCCPGQPIPPLKKELLWKSMVCWGSVFIAK
jgi:hypothetical protein